MKKEKVIHFTSVIIGFAAAILLFLNWNPENLLRGEVQTVTMADARQNTGEDFTGLKAGRDIPRLQGKEDFENTFSSVMTAEPTGIFATGIYELKSWVDPYTRRRNSKGRAYGAPIRKAEFLQYQNPEGLFHNRAEYLPFYLLQLPDKTYILAQIPESDAKAIKRGEHVILPIGRKVIKGIPEALKLMCEEYEAFYGGVYYAFSDEWYETHSFTILALRVGVSIIVLFAISVILILIGEKVFKVNNQKE